MDQSRRYGFQAHADNSMHIMNRDSNLMWRSASSNEQVRLAAVAPFESHRFPRVFDPVSSAAEPYRPHPSQLVSPSFMNGPAARSMIATESQSTVELSLPPRPVQFRSSPPALPPLPPVRAQASMTAMVTPVVKKKRIRLKTDRRREQCRTNQARYRNKQRSFLLDMEKDVVALRDEVERLRQTQQTLHRDVNTRNGAVNWARTYFEYFCRGLNVTAHDRLGQRNGMQRLSQDDQIAFLHSTVRPDVILGDFQGISVVIDQWRSLSSTFDDVVIELLRIDSINIFESQTMLLLNTHCSLTISAKSIDCIFPHLKHNQRLKEKLIGKRLTISAAGEFCLDEHCQLQRVNCSFQFVPPMLSALGNAEDLVAVLDGARIVEEYMVDPMYTPQLIQADS